MCRTTSNEYLPLNHHLRRLKITAFYLRLTVSSPTLLPDSLTLVILPRAASVHVNGSKVHPDSPGFISLHRVLSQDKDGAVFASKDRVRASEGFNFEVHAAQHRLLNGLFRRHDDGLVNSSWRMECKYADGVDSYVAREAEVSVVLEDGQVLTEKVTRPRRCRRRGFRVGLEDIPEERDEGFEPEECCCCCDEVVSSSQSDSDDEFDNSDDGDYQKEMEMEMELNEGVGWAVDVGIWVVCLGVGLLVSTASARKLRRRKLLR